MPRSSKLSQRDLKQYSSMFLQLPRPLQFGLGALLVVGLILYTFGGTRSPFDGREPINTTLPPEGGSNIYFCFWNVENLFDDRTDKRNSIDKDYDLGFSENPELRTFKYEQIATTLLRMNDGKGPDVFCGVEVESPRAAELLMSTLNAKITDPTLKYKSFIMKPINAGRHIGPCVISRLPLSQFTAKLHGQQLRILEAHLFVNNHDLCILGAHWTSQLRQRDGGNGEAGREKYAKTIRDAYAAQKKKNPAADVLVCGDFNSTPESEEVANILSAVGDKNRVLKDPEGDYFFNLMANKDPAKFGTLFYNGKPLIYDQICVSKGMLDDTAWSVDPESVRTITDRLTRVGATRREPWRFGNPAVETKQSERGFADHFPVVAVLSVRPAKSAQPKE